MGSKERIVSERYAGRGTQHYPEHRVNFVAAWTMHRRPVPSPSYSSPSPLISTDRRVPEEPVPVCSACSEGTRVPATKPSTLLCTSGNTARWNRSVLVACSVRRGTRPPEISPPCPGAGAAAWLWHRHAGFGQEAAVAGLGSGSPRLPVCSRCLGERNGLIPAAGWIGLSGRR